VTTHGAADGPARNLTTGGAVLSSVLSQRSRAHSGTDLTKTAAPEAPDPVDVDVGRRIKLRRTAAGVTQTDLAVHLGISFQQVQKYERGANRVSASILVRTAAFLGTTVAELVGEAPGAKDTEDRLTILSTPGAMALLEVFARIQPSLRGAVLQLVRVMADEADLSRRSD
jgi:transcriptional regulator with XRE-family HTH domain